MTAAVFFPRELIINVTPLINGQDNEIREQNQRLV